jgi:NitT/TauT family transport system permease protein
LCGVLITATAGIVITLIADRIQRHFSKWRPNDIGG